MTTDIQLTKPRTITRGKVRWSEEEIKTVTAGMVAALCEHPGERLWELARRAQQALPEHRRRPINADAMIQGIRSAFGEAWRAFVDSANPAATTIDVVPVTEFVEVQPDITKLSTVNVLRLLAERLAYVVELEEKAKAAGGNGHSTYLPQPPPEWRKPAPEPPRKPRVCVIGFLDSQVTQIKQRTANIDDRIDIRFLGTNPALRLPQVDYVIITRFVNHGVNDKAKAACDKVFTVHGIQDAVQRCYDLASQQKRA